MKVVRIITELDFGGVERRIEITAEELVKREDIELIIIALSKGGKIEAKIRDLDITVYCLNLNPKIPNFSIIYKLCLLLNRIKPSVVHTSGAEANFHGLIAAWLSRIPVKIGEEIGFPKHRQLWRFVFRIVYRLSSAVIGISQSVTDYIVNLKEVNENKAVVIYNPVTLSKGVDVTIEVDSQVGVFKFITVCRLVEVKNLKRLLEAFKILIKEDNVNACLWIVGEGPLKKELTEFVKSQKMESYVIFWGYQENASAFLKIADTFIIPSLSEGFSLALVEAMLNELPSIATKIGGPSEILKPNTGRLIDPLDTNSIKSAMYEIYSLDQYRRDLMGKEAKEDAFKRFSPASYIDNLLNLYNSINNE